MGKLKHVYLTKLLESIEEKTSLATIGSAELLTKLTGKKLVVYFYPKDNTPDSITESKGFAYFYEFFQANNTEIIGVSQDSLESHLQFKTEHDLPFELISDFDNIIREVFKVGRNSLGIAGIELKTFLFNAEGFLINEWRNVDVKDHAKSVLYMAESIV